MLGLLSAVFGAPVTRYSNRRDLQVICDKTYYSKEVRDLTRSLVDTLDRLGPAAVKLNVTVPFTFYIQGYDFAKDKPGSSLSVTDLTDLWDLHVLLVDAKKEHPATQSRPAWGGDHYTLHIKLDPEYFT